MTKATEEGNEKFVSAMQYIISKNEGINASTVQVNRVVFIYPLI